MGVGGLDEGPASDTGAALTLGKHPCIEDSDGSLMNGIEDGAMRLLQATREQLHGKPAREVEPCEVAVLTSTPLLLGISPCPRLYVLFYREILQHLYEVGAPLREARTAR